MADFLVGLAFLVMIFGPAAVASYYQIRSQKGDL
jgi:hypothetical protein